MTIDETIENLKEDFEIDMYIRDIAPQIAEWLEELKDFKENKWTDIYIKRGYNKAICDFVGRLHFELLESVGTDKEQMEFAVRVINIVAEQLKEGGENG